ncbi:MAG: hypothetical protein N7Q72_04600, partial [Spiroplasma sp. Tabriz.8]|nr:hypothetical protein [Spiroplasma sp. Tabriz.8]
EIYLLLLSVGSVIFYRMILSSNFSHPWISKIIIIIIIIIIKRLQTIKSKIDKHSTFINAFSSI